MKSLERGMEEVLKLNKDKPMEQQNVRGEAAMPGEGEQGQHCKLKLWRSTEVM